MGTARSSARFHRPASRAVPTLALPTQNALILHRELEALHQFQLWHYTCSTINSGATAHLPCGPEGSSMAAKPPHASKLSTAASMLPGSSKRSLQHQAAQNAARRPHDIQQQLVMLALEGSHTAHQATDGTAAPTAASGSCLSSQPVGLALPTQLQQQPSGEHGCRLSGIRRTSSEAPGAVVAALLGSSLQQGLQAQQEQAFEGWSSRMAWQVCSR